MTRKIEAMRPRQFHLRTLMISIAFLALILTVVLQSLKLREAAIRQEQLRVEDQRKAAAADAALRQFDTMRAQIGLAPL